MLEFSYCFRTWYYQYKQLERVATFKFVMINFEIYSVFLSFQYLISLNLFCDNYNIILLKYILLMLSKINENRL